VSVHQHILVCSRHAHFMNIGSQETHIQRKGKVPGSTRRKAYGLLFALDTLRDAPNPKTTMAKRCGKGIPKKKLA
jgi:hypothetical protein